MTAPAELLASALADRYRVERELGRGGMATVYLAHDLRHHRPVAIKLLRPELAQTLGHERFLREITVTAQLDHPYILPLLDSGALSSDASLTTHDSRLLYYVMPYVEGESLHDRLAREGQLPMEDALRVAREVAEALGHAHAHGIVHRDIKPGNILLSGGHARVADFGIARAVDAAGGEQLTETGLAIGTPAYMSPEQSMGERQLDGRSDLYALGCVLFEMLAGEPPFSGPTAQAIIAKRMTMPAPSARTVRDTVPESVDRALTTVLAKSPADRFATAQEFITALAHGAPPSGASNRGRKRTAWIAGAGAVLAVTLLGGWFYARARAPVVTPSAMTIAVLPFHPSSPDTALERLGRDLVLTISANLDGVGPIRTADPQAILTRAAAANDHGTAGALALGRDLGAGSVVRGDLVRVGSDVRLDLKLLATSGDSAPLARASVTSAPDSISVLTDSVTWALLRQVWRRGEPPSPSYASITTRSWASLRAFLEGEQHTQAGRWPEAIESYASAIQADSSFLLAGLRYNAAQGWVLHGRPDSALEARVVANRHLLGERDRLLVEAHMPVLFADRLARLHALTIRYPDDWDIWFNYADVLCHWGPMAGVTNTEVRAALQRTVDLNPKLVPIWDHLWDASVGQDSVQAARALRALDELGFFTRRSAQLGYDATLDLRLKLAAGGGVLPVPLRDSFAIAVTRSPRWFVRIFAATGLYTAGYPAAQLDLNRRLLALAPRDSLNGLVWEGSSNAWAARGAWDSALAAYQGAVTLGAKFVSPVTLYNFAASGTWLGALDVTRAEQYRAAAVAYLEKHPDSSPVTGDPKAVLAWTDGILAVYRRDLARVQEALVRLRATNGPGNAYLARSLAGFELELRGAKQAAAESLAVLDLGATDLEIGSRHDPYARSITHLAASRWLLEQGDTSRAVKMLAWHWANVPASVETGRTQVFAGPGYYELARIEEAQGQADQALEHYRQFLRRYDMPAPAHQQLVSQANAAVRRLSGIDDAPSSR